ncbi:MAG TPA: flagellar biosynthetic protein FliR [Nocardioides sp.]|uniref:flagellar biosynthetic protein FliR n=1 Tax=uncultured Nocardioides sp. TaxID=198441 RepID=UPI000EE07CFC|nr:flagellar biosynthetic protein FliR [uncultured Nocardioides sp.]HCB04031.1 type III secretion protein [Nocardioides sp.]HRD60400.1 flagellar biosynthetic protein FliR [Nocardioides sp.]HRI97602.1 flagellar biosynthetic protein FliR [Nocardioides sp.]HRK45210.1 flagellar biosynthetic protein FliR [Nocardioides sp.]
MPISIAGEPLIGFLLASVRIVSWLVVVPPFSSRSMPTMVKVVLSLGLAFAAAPAVADTVIATDTIGLITTAFIQVAIGLTMGFVTSLLFGAVAAAGSLVDVFGGFSLAQGFDPLGMNSSTVFGTFHQGLATALLFVSGGYLVVIGGLLKTFSVLPVGAMPDLSGAEDVVTTAFVMFFVTAVQIALPLVAVLFIADLGLALLTKVAPQLNALSVMFPAKIALTLLVVGMSFALLPDVLRNIVDLTLEAMAALAGG